MYALLKYSIGETSVYASASKISFSRFSIINSVHLETMFFKMHSSSKLENAS